MSWKTEPNRDTEILSACLQVPSHLHCILPNHILRDYKLSPEAIRSVHVNIKLFFFAKLLIGKYAATVSHELSQSPGCGSQRNLSCPGLGLQSE